jgi:hypothetical protein
MEYPHLILRYPKSGSEATIEDSAILKKSNSGRITNISTHNSSEGFSLLPGTDYICLAAQRMNIHTKYYDLTYKIPPFNVPKLTLSLCRHIEKDNDQAVLWVISQIKDIVEKNLKKP